MNVTDLPPFAHKLSPELTGRLDELDDIDALKPTDLARLLYAVTKSSDLPEPVFTATVQANANLLRTVWIYDLAHWSAGALIVSQTQLQDYIEVTGTADLGQAYRTLGEQLGAEHDEYGPMP